MVAFIVSMDLLKYGFGIDPTRYELERIRRQKRAKKTRRPVIVRYIYANAPPTTEPAPVPQTLANAETAA